MELSGVPPPSINWEATNLPDEWDKFQNHVELIFSGPLKGKNEEEQISYLLLWVGEQGRQIRKTWTDISAEDVKKVTTFYTRFKKHVQPKLNPIFVRYRFNNEVQGSDSIDAFVTRLRIRARDCNFRVNDTTDITDDMIRDRIVFGCSSAKVREKLINEGDKLTMDKAVQVVQNYEYCQQQLSSMNIASASNVDAVKTANGTSRQGARRKFANHGRRQETRSNPKQRQSCGKCGPMHSKDNVCPAKGKQCHKCNKMNHFQVVCRSTKSVHQVTLDDSSESNDQEYSIDMVSATCTKFSAQNWHGIL